MPFGQGSRVPSAAEMTTRMITGAQNNAQKWLDNTLNPKKNPKQQAVRSAAKYKQRMQESLQRDDWAKAVASYDEEAAVEAIRNAGTSAYVNGISSRSRKIQGKMERYVPLLTQHLQKIDAMPSGSEAEAIAKMTENMKGLKAIGVALKGGGR